MRRIAGVLSIIAVAGALAALTRRDPPQVEVLNAAVTTTSYVEVEGAPTPPAPESSSSTVPVSSTTTPATFEVATTTTVPGPVTLAFTGDVIAHVAVSDSARTAPGEYDFSPMFDRVAPVIWAADLAICHLETPLDPESRTPKGFPNFSAPAEVADALVEAGYDGCSTSSNHVIDRGLAGIGQTLDVLDAAGLGHTGSARTPEERSGRLYEAGGLVVGHASYSYNVAGWLSDDDEWRANGLDEAQMLADAADLRGRGAEFVVLSIHWGIEHQYTPTHRQRQLGEALLASPDVDLIVGHHAHVLQPVAEIDGEYLFYGLGNFLSNQEPGCCGEEAQEGAIMLVRVEPSRGGWAASDVAYVPTWVDRHRDYLILPTLAWDVSDHRHAAWLQRSAERVGRSLQLEAAALSVEAACRWMGAECRVGVEAAD